MPVTTRGYSPAGILDNYYYLNSHAHIIAGDYNPDYRVSTRFTNPIDTLNTYERFYSTHISAPGMIWTTSFFPVMPNPGVPIAVGDPILGLGTNTSIAAPQIAGAVALVGSVYPWMSASELKTQIMLSGRYLDRIVTASQSFVPNTPASFFGAGALDMMGALYLHGSHNALNLDSSDYPKDEILLGKELNLTNSTIHIRGALRIQPQTNVVLDQSNSLNLYAGSSIILDDGAVLEVRLNSNTLSLNDISFTCSTPDNPGKVIFNGGITQFMSCQFNNVKIETMNGNLTVNTSAFVNSTIKAYMPQLWSGDKIANVTNSTFSNTIQINNSSNNAIYLIGFNEFLVSNNVISNYFNGLIAEECVDGMIENNSISNCQNAGVYLYHTITTINGYNSIKYNKYGVYATRYSVWSMTGNMLSYPHQEIKYNTNEEILFSSNSLPGYIRYCEIFDTNHTYDYVKSIGTPASTVDIRYNYWGTGFNASIDLYPASSFNYLPVWTPQIPTTLTMTQDETLYNSALTYESEGEFNNAEAEYRSLINTYPQSALSKNVLNTLLNIERYSDNDYQDLKSYYQTNPVSDSLEASYLSNYCNIQLSNFNESLGYFENIINNPPSVQDSLCAIVDFINLNQYMEENGTKSEYKALFKKYLPKNIKQINEFKNKIFADLTRENLSFENSTNDLPIKPVELFANYPNPFNPSTTISYSLPETSHVSLKVYNIKGQLVKTLVNGSRDKGVSKEVWHGDNDDKKPVTSGIYLYKLQINNETLTRKMMLIK
ncbi:MAG TPA: T9SS type A sorting domain-containing protein [Candidatus Cloacimonadota bacterium]|nr:T9SS type A sorting domain-containing protein [Candidatus Cloacimonadota bacterium]